MKRGRDVGSVVGRGLLGVCLVGSLSAAPLLPSGKFRPNSTRPAVPELWTTRHAENWLLVPDERFGHALKLFGDENLFAGYGAEALSTRIPFVPNHRYRLTGYARSEGPNQIVFVKGYSTRTAPKGSVSNSRLSPEGGPPETPVYQIRQEIKPTKEWERFELEFTLSPFGEFSQVTGEVEYLRLTLWAYWPAGACYYADVGFEDLGVDPRAPTTSASTHRPVAPRLGAASTQASGDEEDDNAEARFDAAANAFTAGEYAVALPAAQKLVAEQPENPEYRLLLARTLEGMGRKGEVLPHARWLVEHAADYHREWGEYLLAVCSDPVDRAKLGVLERSAKSPHVRQAAGAKLAEGK